MPREWSCARIAGTATLIVTLAGCSREERRDARTDALVERLDRIEKRLDSVETRLVASANVSARLDALEGRTAALEARPAAVAPPYPPPAARPDGGVDPSARWSPRPSVDATTPTPPSGGAPWGGQGQRR